MRDYKNYTGYKGEDPNKIRADLRSTNGIQFTEGLFVETSTPGSVAKYDPKYTLKDWENKGLPSAYQIYINSIDESDAALKLVGSLTHWRKLCNLRWFMSGRKEVGFEGVMQWRDDMTKRDRTLAKEILLEQTKDGNVTAARALDKMAQEEAKEHAKDLPKKRSSREEDTFEFLNDYRK